MQKLYAVVVCVTGLLVLPKSSLANSEVRNVQAFNSKKCLANVGKGGVAECSDKSKLTLKPVGAETFMLESAGQCIFSNADGRFAWYQCNAAWNDQHWGLVRPDASADASTKGDDGWRMLKNVNSGKCLFSNADGRFGVYKCEQKFNDQFWLAAEPLPKNETQATVQSVDTGPIWNGNDAKRKCPGVCGARRWTGHWRTTKVNKVSQCDCETVAVQVDVSQVLGTFDGVHPHWRDTVTIDADGTYRRGNGDPGKWTFDGKTLTLDWKNWGVAKLDLQAPGKFVGGTFSLTRSAVAVPTPPATPAKPAAPAVVTPPATPAASAALAAMSDADFQAIVAAVGAESFSQQQLDALEMASKGRHYSVAQVGELIELFSFSKDKINALKLMNKAIVDKQNAFKLLERFTFSADKTAAKKILAE